MCGLVGFLDPRKTIGAAEQNALIGVMADRLAHRGPDDRALWCDADAGVALGFRRLAILDLSTAGRQPMVSADGNLVMVFNGEIYNHHALRAELEQASIGSWRGHSDSEVLLAAIQRWGFAATLPRLNGMFAVAVWDRRARRLHLARDRFGEKPLYYGRLGGVFFFASELKALDRHPAWTGSLEQEALALFLRHAYVPAPWTAFAGFKKLLPGCRIEIGSDGEASEPQAYWSALERAAEAAVRPFAGTLAEAVERLQMLIDDAVTLRLEADVPVGVFLSGGVDSSTVVAAMQRARPGAVHSFCIGFPDPAYDESAYAALVARHIGTQHATLQVTEADCMAVLPHMAEFYDEPFADASQLPTVLLCRLARRHVTVSLSGDGGDEFFGGYPRYTAAASAWARTLRRPRFGAIARRVRKALPHTGGYVARGLRKRLASIASVTPAELYRRHVSRWHEGEGLLPGFISEESVSDALPHSLPSLEQNFMLHDVMTYLPDDLLVKIDRASMAVGLEVRAPLLDHRIAEFAWSLPPTLAVAGGPKRLLREALYRRVPQSLINRKKQGFEPPIGRWLRTGLRDWADDLLGEPRLKRMGLVDPRIVAARWHEHRTGRRNRAHQLWTVLMLEEWLEHVGQ
jgi:asparagine synthase (glutamine-hydrolysing)